MQKTKKRTKSSMQSFRYHLQEIQSNLKRFTATCCRNEPHELLEYWNYLGAKGQEIEDLYMKYAINRKMADIYVKDLESYRRPNPVEEVRSLMWFWCCGDLLSARQYFPFRTACFVFANANQKAGGIALDKSPTKRMEFGCCNFRGPLIDVLFLPTLDIRLAAKNGVKTTWKTTNPPSLLHFGIAILLMSETPFKPVRQFEAFKNWCPINWYVHPAKMFVGAAFREVKESQKWFFCFVSSACFLWRNLQSFSTELLVTIRTPSMFWRRWTRFWWDALFFFISFFFSTIVEVFHKDTQLQVSNETNFLQETNVFMSAEKKHTWKTVVYDSLAATCGLYGDFQNSLKYHLKRAELLKG